jgi:hypothetical protein
VWNHSVFSKNRDRLFENEVVETFFAEVMRMADKAHDTADFIASCRQRKITPHVAQNDTRRGGSAIDGRTTRHAGYRLSQAIRKRIEEHFGWGKTVGRIRQTVFRGIRRVDQHFKLTMTASNLRAWRE